MTTAIMNECWRIAYLLTAICISVAISSTVQENRAGAKGEYCQSDSFKPQCLKNEVVFIKSAAYGRMNIGRCITAEEVAAQRLLTGGDDPRVLGCSVDVSTLLDRKCSGKTDCDVRVVDLSHEVAKPCFPGLIVYLEASYSCVPVADDKRSCSVRVSSAPIYLTPSSSSAGICGTKSQPWIVEATAGQKVSIRLIDFGVAQEKSEQERQRPRTCVNFGQIMDVASKENKTICGGGHQREQILHLSKRNSVKIFFNVDVSTDSRFLLGVEAVGCSDIVPPDETWLQRNDDAIVIGCYSSRQSWRLSCKDGRWIGVLGNCSQDTPTTRPRIDAGDESSLSENGQVLAIVAIAGFTVAVCLVIICVGAVCLRRFYFEIKRKHDYKTLGYTINTVRSNNSDFQDPSSDILNTRHSAPGFTGKLAPTYSVYVGDNDTGNTDLLVASTMH